MPGAKDCFGVCRDQQQWAWLWTMRSLLTFALFSLDNMMEIVDPSAGCCEHQCCIPMRTRRSSAQPLSRVVEPRGAAQLQS